MALLSWISRRPVRSAKNDDGECKRAKRVLWRARPDGDLGAAPERHILLAIHGEDRTLI